MQQAIDTLVVEKQVESDAKYFRPKWFPNNDYFQVRNAPTLTLIQIMLLRIIYLISHTLIGKSHSFNNKCPAANAICRHCFTQGHYQNVCFSKHKQFPAVSRSNCNGHKPTETKLPDVTSIFVDDYLGFSSEADHLEPVILDTVINDLVVQSQVHNGI